MLSIHGCLDVSDFAPHSIHLSFKLGEEEIKISTLVLDEAFEEDFVLLDNGLFVVEVLLLEHVVKDATLLLVHDPEHLSQLLCLTQACGGNSIEHVGKLVDSLACVLVRDLGLDYALGDGAPNFHQHVGEAFDAAGILLVQPTSELQLRLFWLQELLNTTSPWL